MTNKAVSIRFTNEELQAIDKVALEHKMSRSEVVRLCVSGNVANMPSVTITDSEKIAPILYELLTEMQAVKNELNRIGVNFNQALKIAQAERCYKITKDYNALKEMTMLQHDKNLLNKDELNALMERYENATKKAGEQLCHILA